MEKYVIIVAGGTGTRMQSELPKQFVELCGKEIIVHTIERFLKFDPEIHIIISVHADFKEHLGKLFSKHKFQNIKVVEGGKTRFHSVKNALDTLTVASAVVGIHDAARPLVSIDTIQRCFTTAAAKGNAIPCVTLSESVREVIEEKNKAVNRNNYRIIQTPQCFRISDIKKAFELPYNDNFTDDASVLEANGGTIHLVEGNEENIKITLPKDLLIAKTFLEND
jgi:2-C-methyl-D-erythritol 4-phosphate cytidylyltransferase